MPNNLIGVVVHSDYVDVVLLQQVGPKSFALQDETTLKLQTGDRPPAYHILHSQFQDYVKQHRAKYVCVKQSALSRGAMKMVHLKAAELRGIIQCGAAAAGAEVCLFNKASVSRTSGAAGGRKVDEYLKDNSYWSSIGLSSLPKGMREAAFVVVEEFLS
jgi:hypothetical protein